MRSLTFAGKDEPDDEAATAEIVRAAKDDQIVFAVIETATGRTIYTNVHDEDAQDLIDWLLSGVLEGVRDDLTRPKPRAQ